MNRPGEASGQRRRRPTFRDETRHLCLFSLPLRYAKDMTQSVPQWAGLTGLSPTGVPISKWNGYRRRSLVKAQMRCFKPFGEQSMTGHFARQAGKRKMRAAIPNRLPRLYTPIMAAMPSRHLCDGKPVP
jgi:hypothetical protein